MILLMVDKGIVKEAISHIVVWTICEGIIHINNRAPYISVRGWYCELCGWNVTE